MPFVRVECLWAAANEKNATFQLRFETSAAVVAADLVDLAEAATVESNTHVAALFCPDISWRKWGAVEYERVVPTAPDKPFFSDLTLMQFGATNPTAGAVAGESSDPSRSLVVSLQADAPGRRALGRVYTPPLPESVVNADGTVDDGVARKDWVQEVAEAVEAAIAGGTCTHIVHSVTYGDANEVISYEGGVRIDTQRRRLQRQR